MRNVILIAGIVFGVLLGGALAGCRTTQPEPPTPVLRPRQLPLATDMILLDDQEERPSIAF